jgi:hypothetical protein
MDGEEIPRPMGDNSIPEEWKQYPLASDFIKYEFNKVYLRKGSDGILMPWTAMYPSPTETRTIRWKRGNYRHKQVIVCKMCDNKIKKPSRGRPPCVCSPKCRRKLNLQHCRIRYASSTLEQCINHRRKVGEWKKCVSFEYCLNLFKRSKGYCYWCGVKCILHVLRDKKVRGPFNPDVFSFDAVISSAGHIYGNLVISCMLCNNMKHAMALSMWLVLLTFFKTKTPAILDLKKNSFLNKNGLLKPQNNGRKIHEPWDQLKERSRKYYKAYGAPFKTFRKIFKKQNGLDGVFSFFPLVYLKPGNYYNVSCDAINSSLPNEEKHRPNNIQIIPVFLQYAKNIQSNAQLIQSFKKRGFRTDYTDCKVNLPDKYKSESWLEGRIQTGKSSGKGHKGRKHSAEQIENFRRAVKGRTAPNKKKVNMIDPKTNEIIKSFDSQQDAASYVKGSIGSISLYLNNKLAKKIYKGYKWRYAV